MLALGREVGLHGIDVDGHVVVHLEVEVGVDLLREHGEHLERLARQV